MYDAHALARWRPEPPKAAGYSDRNPLQRDRARVLHAAALRRLAGKTQVVGIGESDFPRTRLTHSLECAQIGREMGQALGADPDLVDAACLAHDLGHPPFGHNGEQALDEIAVDCGGFEGNAQSLRILTRLEVKIEGAGLNLTRATLDAATKYPWTRPEGGGKFGVYADDLPVFTWLRAGAPAGRRSLETQLMDWADDVAYSVHDYEDGVYAGQIRPASVDPDAVIATAVSSYLPGCEPELLADSWGQLVAQPWWVAGFDGGPADTAALKAMTSELIGRFCGHAVAATRAAFGTGSLVRYAADLVVPEQVRRESALLKAVAMHYVMSRRGAEQQRQRELVTELVLLLRDRGGPALEPLLRPAWAAAGDDCARLRVVVDQVASLTDVSAATWRDRLGGSAGGLR
ncbi:MAG TPA: deoxyguanosinetriphosphate triphosphohydrolase [Mycobacteriales bacterium]|nr:deoxyguanosinetriphosphate triphosphohydrolase [Mycobacteriales bacterium]